METFLLANSFSRPSMIFITPVSSNFVILNGIDIRGDISLHTIRLLKKVKFVLILTEAANNMPELHLFKVCLALGLDQ